MRILWHRNFHKMSKVFIRLFRDVIKLSRILVRFFHLINIDFLIIFINKVFITSSFLWFCLCFIDWGWKKYLKIISLMPNINPHPNKWTRSRRFTIGVQTLLVLSSATTLTRLTPSVQSPILSTETKVTKKLQPTSTKPYLF